MKTVKKNFLNVCIIALFVSLFTVSCTEIDYPQVELTKEEAIQEDASKFPDMDAQEIKETDPIIVSLKQSAEILNYDESNGQLLWNLATITKFDSEESLPMISVPIGNGSEGKEITMLMAAYNSEKNSFLTFINTIDMESLVNSEESVYSGVVGFKTTANELVSELTFERGELMKEEHFDLKVSKAGINIQCFLNCFIPLAVGAAGGGLLGGFCAGSATYCIPAPVVANPSCVALAGCLLYWGGTGAYCAYNCSY